MHPKNKEGPRSPLLFCIREDETIGAIADPSRFTPLHIPTPAVLISAGKLSGVIAYYTEYTIRRKKKKKIELIS